MFATKHRAAAALVALALAGACSDDKASKPKPAADDEPAAKAKAMGKGRVVVSVTVDWEGAYLSPAALDALSKIRDALPGVPFTHFVCAAYFTKPIPIPNLALDLRAEIIDGDEIGLHIHAWKTLVTAAGVEFEEAPTFREDELLEFPDGDRGFEVSLTAYTTDELRKIIRLSRDHLARAKLPAEVSFRAAGYSANADVLSAVAAEGYLVDSSSSDPAWYDEAEGRFSEHVKKMWPEVSELEQPFYIETSAGKILEMPNTGSFVDYATAEEMRGHIEKALARLEASPDEDVFVNVGIHQETADEHADQLVAAIAPLRKQAGDELVFLTVADAARRARSQLDAGPAERPTIPPETTP